MWKKGISSILIFIILMLWVPIEPISHAIAEGNISIASTEARVGVKTIDLTGLTTGIDANHTHIYEKKYDSTNHWEECWICHNKINIHTHHLATSGTAGCARVLGHQQQYCTDGCGYNITLPKVAHTPGNFIPYKGRHFHIKKCTVCREEASVAEHCVDAQGRELGCKTGLSGTCVVCGQVVDGTKHAVIFNECCEICGKRLCETNITTQVLGGTSVKLTITQKILDNSIKISLNGLNEENMGSCWIPRSTYKVSNVTYTNNADGSYTFSGIVTFEEGVLSPEAYDIHFNFVREDAPVSMHLGTSINPDNYAPTKNSITTAQNGTAGNYSTKATVTASYTDTYTYNNVVYMRLIDRDKNTVISNWGTATQNGTTYTKTFDVVAEIRDPANVYVQAKDVAGNITTLEDGAITVQYIDALAPRLTGGKNSSTNWTQNKQITYTTLDQGVGGVQIAFNNQSDFQAANQSGDSYTRTYNFIGDVYGDVTAALYIKDALGNIRTEKVTISNIDNTKPTITNVTQTVSSNKKSVSIGVSANDINTTLNKSGSGVAGYAITTTNIEPSSGFQSTLTVNKNGTYYVWAKDNAGNVSDPTQIVVRGIENTLTVNPNGGIWSGSAQNQNFALTYGATKAIAAPTRNGFTFTGWSITGGGSSINGTTLTMGYENATLTANWQRNNYTLTVNPNGGTWGGSAQSQNFTLAYEATKAIAAPTRNGYTFTGWSIAGTGSSINGTTFKMGYQNASLTANWQLITHNITGNVSWNDQNNKYYSRPANVTVTLGRTPTTGAVTALPAGAIVAGNANYTFSNVQTYDTTTGRAYNYAVVQNKVPGYETVINGYSITNNLILPAYTAQVAMTPYNSFENKYLKNGEVKITGIITANANNRNKVGTCKEGVTFQIDTGIQIDRNSIKVSYINKNGTIKELTNYSINNNTITTTFESNRQEDTTAGDSIKIELIGTLNEIKQYSNTIIYTGYLRDYQTGENTNINLGTLAQASSQEVTAENQLPEAKIQIKKVDSITEEILTDATFTLYEWNGSRYIAKEVIRDTNKDGIYESSTYRWNATTQGKYKIVESSVPTYHKDLNFFMEYSLNELHTQNYTIMVDYDNKGYVIQYGKRNPDDFDSINGTVENEPYKLKAQIRKIDKETQNIIEAESEFTIYEWNKETGNYEEYNSYTNNQTVTMERQEDKTYLTGEWLYYTPKNEGKYRIVETKAPDGYYGDYENGQKKSYDISILEIIQNQNYNGQTIANEGTIIIENVAGGNLENTRTKAALEIHVLDRESQVNIGQADSKIEGAVYGLYAYENIYHADGVTTRYPGEKGLLYKKDELIEAKTTNQDGIMNFEDLECGNYYLKMITAPEGYVKDENKYAINLSYQGEEIAKVTLVGKIDMQVKKQAFQIYKLKENLSALNNAGFSIYLISDLSIVKEGKITRVTASTYMLNDKKAKEDVRLQGKANEDGTYNLPDLIDYYYKRYIGVEENAGVLPGDSQSYYPYNMNSENYVKNYENSTQGEDIAEQKTSSNGYLKSPELAYGEYIVVETSVPREQDVTNPFIVTVVEDNREAQDIRFIIDNDFKTRVKIYKKDQETKQTILGKQASYVIRNAETNELMTKKVWVPSEGYVEYGTLDHPFETQETGYLITPMELGIGEYILEEVKAPEGYTLNGYEGSSENGEIKWEREEKLRFSINTNTAYYTDSYLGKYVIVINQENKATVGTIKIKTATGEFLSKANKQDPYEFIYETRLVVGAKYKVCAKEDIYTQDNQASLVYNKDEIVTYLTTDAKGEAIVENLPLGKYYIKEVEPAEGFSLKEEKIEVELSYEGQEIPVVFREIAEEEIRQKIEIVIHNKDSETGEKRTGGKYELYTKEEISYQDAQGNTNIIPANEKMITLTANEEGIMEMKKEVNIDLPRGKYYLKEVEAPTGYALQEEVLELDATKEKLEEIIKIEKDFLGIKTNLNVVEVNEENQITTGSTFEIRNRETNEVVETWTTEGEVKNFRKLETNVEYVIVETKPTSGYTTAEEVNFMIKENGILTINGVEQTENTITIQDYKTKIQIQIKDEITKEYVIGPKWQIIRKTEETEEIMAEWTSSGNAQMIEKLPIGEYILREVEIPENSGYVTIEEITFYIEDTKEIQILEVKQNVTKVEIHIKDEDSKEYSIGSTWQLVKKTKETEEVVREWSQEGKLYEPQKLPIGEYVLREINIGENTGYVTNQEQTIQIQDTREVQIFEIEQKISKIEIYIKDEDTKEYTTGSTWQLVKKTGEDEEVVREWTANGEVYKTERLPVGSYVLREVNIGENTGYVTNQEQTIQIQDTREVQIFEEEQKISKIEIHIKDEDTKEYTTGSTWQLVKKTEETEEVVKEWTENGEVYNTERLPVGSYILREVNIGENTGYVTSQEQIIEIQDIIEVQIFEEQQRISKVKIHLKDIETEEYVEESVMQIIKKTEEQEEVIREWTTEKDGKLQEKIPVGTYILRQTSLPKHSGYVTIEEKEIRVEDSLEEQEIQVKQDFTKVRIEIVDEETKEKINQLELQIIEKETGNVVAKTKEIEQEENDKEEAIEEDSITITETEKGYYLERIPIGTYILKEKTPDGYREVEEIEIKVEDIKDIQVIQLENQRLIYDIQLEKELKSITIDGKKTEIATREMQKIEIRESAIKNIDIRLEYVIRVKNIGETTATVGNIIDHIPNGFQVVSEGWKQEKKQAIWEQSKQEELASGESKEVTITLKWENGILNFGEKKNTAEIEGSTNPYGYEDKTKDNNIGEEITVFSVRTGIEDQIIIVKIILITLAASLFICLIAGIEILVLKRKQNKY